MQRYMYQHGDIDYMQKFMRDEEGCADDHAKIYAIKTRIGLGSLQKQQLAQFEIGFACICNEICRFGRKHGIMGAFANNHL